MPMLKTVNTRGKYHDADSLNDVIQYILQPHKAIHGYVGGAYVDPDDAATSMLLVADQWGKTKGVQLRHFVISFDYGEVSNLSVVNEIAKAASSYLAQQHQVVFAVHEDKPHIHIHIVANAVSYIDGHRYRGTKAEFYAFVNYINRALHHYKLPSLRYAPTYQD